MHPTKLLPLLLLASAVTQATDPTMPYAGQQNRTVMALDDAEVAGLLAGKGLGMAKAAELNRYPGPAHVLELADRLELTPGQREATTAIHARMLERARALGARLVEAETRLDALFRSGDADPERVTSALDDIARLQAELRATHLLAHVEQRALLTQAQIERYVVLRGYAGHHGHGGHRQH